MTLSMRDVQAALLHAELWRAEAAGSTFTQTNPHALKLMIERSGDDLGACTYSIRKEDAYLYVADAWRHGCTPIEDWWSISASHCCSTTRTAS